MMPEFLPVSLGAASKQLGIEPFELTRLVVAAGEPVGRLEFNAARIEAIRRFAGIERWWGEGTTPPADDVPLRGVLRGALQRMLETKRVGDQRTRQDNLWRGLPTKQRRFVEDVIDVLVEHGLVSVRAEATGVMISIRPEAIERVQALAEGRDVPDDVARLWS